MLVILTVHIFYCPEARWKIAFTAEESGANLPTNECSSWMHWKCTTISGDISSSSKPDEITDVDVVKGLMAKGYYVGSEADMKLELGLY